MTTPRIPLLDDLDALAAKATPGPWEWDDTRPDDSGLLPYVPQGSHLGNTLICLDDTYENSREDCALVEALRNNYASLSALIRRQGEALEIARDALMRLAHLNREFIDPMVAGGAISVIAAALSVNPSESPNGSTKAEPGDGEL